MKHNPGDARRPNTTHGDNRSNELFQARLAEQRRTLRYRYTVALGAQVHTARGTLVEGDEVKVDDLVDAMNGMAPHARMKQLIHGGVVLQAEDYQLRAAVCPPDARYRVAPGKCILVNGRQFGPGEQVKPEEIGEDNVRYFISKHCVVDRGPQSTTNAARRRRDEPPTAA